jgi:hypothetical protein
MTPRKKSTHLKGLEKITKFLQICLNSASIKGEKPLSILLVAPVSSGKTTTIKQFKKNKNVLITTDSTAYGILKNYEKELKNREISYIFIPDLLNALSRKKQTAEQLILFINSSSEDGLFPSKTYGMDTREYIEPFGWVLCITKDAFKKKYKFLENIGFISRFFVIEYSYNLEQINTILEDIMNETILITPDIRLKPCKVKKDIKGNKEIFKQLLVYSKLLSRNENAEILRTQKKLQTFLKASAYTRGDCEVKQQDLNELVKYIDLIKVK